ncbi:MAG: cytidylate kinase-like family protein [Acidobacteria bacterium]|nr:MAG: cytidylate kinase-like family protein [Acidobacteriota bacterium]
MFNAITVSREYGSGGGKLAETLAERLGWKLVDKSLVVEVATRAKIDPETAARLDESIDPWFYRLVKGLWQGGYEGLATTVDARILDSEGMAKLAGEIIREAATLGHCVIVGRGGQCILRKRPEVFHVSVFGPCREKVLRLRERLAPGTDAERVMEETDRRRATYISRYYGEDWKDRRLYHLVISSALGLETLRDTVLCAAGLIPRAS